MDHFVKLDCCGKCKSLDLMSSIELESDRRGLYCLKCKIASWYNPKDNEIKIQQIEVKINE